MNDAAYTAPKLPNRSERIWSRDDLTKLDPSAGSAYLKAEVITAGIQVLLPRIWQHHPSCGGADEYDTSALRSVNILDASHAVSAFADNIPVGKGVLRDDLQPYPVYDGWR